MIISLLLLPIIANAAEESFCPAGFVCGDDDVRFCSENKYCINNLERSCPSPWICPEGSKSPRGIGIRNYDSSFEEGMYKTTTETTTISSHLPKPRVFPISLSDLKQRGHVNLRSVMHSNLCAHVDEAKDLGRVSLRTCNEESLNQQFYMNDNGQIRSKLSTRHCLEMDPDSEWGGVFLHSKCLDRWEIPTDTGILRNIGDDKCLAAANSEGGQLTRSQCGPTNGGITSARIMWGIITKLSSNSSDNDESPSRISYCYGNDANFRDCIFYVDEEEENLGTITINGNLAIYDSDDPRHESGIGVKPVYNRVFRDYQTWQFERTPCPVAAATLPSSSAINTSILSSYLSPSAPSELCYLIINNHSGRRLFAQVNKEGPDGFGAWSGQIYDDNKWRVVKDQCSSANEECSYKIINAYSGRRLYFIEPENDDDDYIYNTKQFLGATTRPSTTTDSWFIPNRALSTNKEILYRHPIVCNAGVLTSMKLQVNNSGDVHYAYSCDDLDPATGSQDTTEMEFIFSSVESLEDATFQCKEPGQLLSGIWFETPNGEGKSKAVSRCTNIRANTDVCTTSYTGKTPLYLEGRRSPNPMTHLSSLPIGCNLGQALRSIQLKNLHDDSSSGSSNNSAMYEIECCEITKVATAAPVNENNDVTTTALETFIAITANVTQCGIRHGWITPDYILEESQKFHPDRFLDRVFVFEKRVRTIVDGIDDGFYLPDIIDTLREEHNKLIRATRVSDVIENAFTIERILMRDGPGGEGRCPSAPVFRWKKASSGTSITTALEFGLVSEWGIGTFEEFVKGVTESREESHGTELTSGTESTTGSSETITDTFSVSVGVEYSTPFVSASVELGYEQSSEQGTFQEETVVNSETRSVDLSTGITQEVSNSIGQEIVRTSSVSETRSCETVCESDDDYQVIIWQWVFEQTDPNTKAATVYTCTFVCRSAIFNGPPICPGGRCLNNDCTNCMTGTFSNPEMDRIYSNSNLPETPTSKPFDPPTSKPSDSSTEGPSGVPSRFHSYQPSKSLVDNIDNNGTDAFGSSGTQGTWTILAAIPLLISLFIM